MKKNIKFRVHNIFITERHRAEYKYVIVRDVKDDNGNTAYYFYDFSNDLYSASMVLREIGNGIILEMNQVE